IYVLYGRLGIVSALFFGLKAAVLSIVLHAVHRIGKRALRSMATLWLAAVAFVSIFFLGAPFPAVVLAAGAIGYAAGRSGIAGFDAS
ncbi:chromate transporter, partial [Klebsiella aerogenes]